MEISSLQCDQPINPTVKRYIIIKDSHAETQWSRANVLLLVLVLEKANEEGQSNLAAAAAAATAAYRLPHH